MNVRGHAPPERLEDGAPRCPIGQTRVPPYRFEHTRGYQVRIFHCPVLHPQPTGATCTQEQFAKGTGCVKYLNISAGGAVLAALRSTVVSLLHRAGHTRIAAALRANSQRPVQALRLMGLLVSSDA